MKVRSDEELVREVQAGSIEAFEVLVKKYQDKLLRYCSFLLKDEFAAEEVVQDTFLSLYKTIERVNTTKKFSSYLYKIAKNFAISKLRKPKREVAFEDLEFSLKSDDDVYERLVSRGERKKILDSLKRLERKYREVIRLYYFEDMSYKEIGGNLNLPLNTIKTRIRRGKERLRKIIKYEK